jgi:aspartate kinase
MERQNTIISKLGGSVLVDSQSFRQASRVINAHNGRNIAVVSALGATNLYPKATNELYQGHRLDVTQRYAEIARELQCENTLLHIEQLAGHLPQARSIDLIASRGEWLSARLLAEYMGAEFIDAIDLIRVSDHQIHESSFEIARQRLEGSSDRVIVPGFYGLNLRGRIETLTRNGSDVTAAVLTGGLQASRLVLWKDVSGIYDTDPRIHSDAQVMPMVDFEYLRQHPSQAIHPDSLRFIGNHGTELQIRSIFQPELVGTRVLQKVPIPQRS